MGTVSSDKSSIEITQQQSVVISSQHETTKTEKEAINKQTAVMLSDEEDKLRKDQEETEKDKRDIESLPKSSSGAIKTDEETVDANLPDASTESHPLPVDEGVDLSDDNIDESPIAGKELIHKIKEGAIIETK